MTCEVLRPIEALGRTLQPGEVVDVDAWRPRNVQALIANGRLREMALSPAPEGLEWKLVPQAKTAASQKPRKAGEE